MKVLIIFPISGPSLDICILDPLNTDLNTKIQTKITHLSFVTNHHLKGKDLIIMLRPSNSKAWRILMSARQQGIPVISVYDDNFLAMYENSDFKHEFQNFPYLVTLTRIIKSSSSVVTFSPLCFKDFKNISSHTRLFRLSFSRNINSNRNLNTSNRRPIKIVYATSRSTEDKLSRILDIALQRLINEYDPSQLEVHFFGSLRPYWDIGKRVQMHSFTPNYKKFRRYFLSTEFDIGLAPMLDSHFYNSKTDNKYREYGSSNIVGVYSKVEPYLSSVTHDFDGLLVNNDSDEWYKAIKYLIENADKRVSLCSNALSNLNSKYSMEDLSKNWSLLISSFIREPTKAKLSASDYDYFAISANKSFLRVYFCESSSRFQSLVNEFGNDFNVVFVPTSNPSDAHLYVGNSDSLEMLKNAGLGFSNLLVEYNDSIIEYCSQRINIQADYHQVDCDSALQVNDFFRIMVSDLQEILIPYTPRYTLLFSFSNFARRKFHSIITYIAFARRVLVEIMNLIRYRLD